MFHIYDGPLSSKTITLSAKLLKQSVKINTLTLNSCGRVIDFTLIRFIEFMIIN